MTDLRDGDLVLRPPRGEDAAVIDAMLAEPAVREWWPDGDWDRPNGWVIELDGRFAGWLQYTEEDWEWAPSVGLDISLTTTLHGRGTGRRVLGLAIEHFRAKGHHRFTIDPSTRNARAIRCYEAAGFERIGVMHACDRRADGSWDDGLLMEQIVWPTG